MDSGDQMLQYDWLSVYYNYQRLAPAGELNVLPLSHRGGSVGPKRNTQGNTPDRVDLLKKRYFASQKYNKSSSQKEK